MERWYNLSYIDAGCLVEPVGLNKPRFGKPGVMTPREIKLLKAMSCNKYYSNHDLCKITYFDISTISELTRRLYQKDMISAFLCYDNMKTNGKRYMVYTPKILSEKNQKLLSETFLKRGS